MSFKQHIVPGALLCPEGCGPWNIVDEHEIDPYNFLGIMMVPEYLVYYCGTCGASWVYEDAFDDPRPVGRQ